MFALLQPNFIFIAEDEYGSGELHSSRTPVKLLVTPIPTLLILNGLFKYTQLLLDEFEVHNEFALYSISFAFSINIS